MKNKILSLLLGTVLALAFVFAGCGEDPVTFDDSLPEIPEGKQQFVLYYNRPAGYENCDVWLWYDGADGRGYLFTQCSYGARIVVDLPKEITEVGFIIRTSCTEPGGTSWGDAKKDGTDSDRSAVLSGERTIIYTKAGDAQSYASEDGGKTLEVIRKVNLADMLDTKRISILMSDTNTQLKKDEVKVSDADGNDIAITSIMYNTVTLEKDLDITAKYTLTVSGLDPVTVIPKSYFSSKSFENAYAYDGKLGVELSESSTVFRLWAPTASKVTLNIYDADEGGSAQKTDMVKGEKGVWSHTANANLSGKYYTYTVTTAVGTSEAVDPYAVSAGVNGRRGMILDISKVNPEGWNATPFSNPDVKNYTDAEIWEVHVRDFSNNITSSSYKGKYLAFTERGLTNSSGIPVGVDYLVNLGITHVHLQPTFDFASVDEAKNTDSDPANDSFNWGYDPLNYNVPEGSYATDASDGTVRVREFKAMVQALHNAGIGVILDMVYNHTYSADSNLNAIVPYYYYRYNAQGTLSNGSGCGNETASERAMMRRFILDSVKLWQTEYNVDGFRFDLMGLHDIDTMNAVEKQVHAVNPKALVYGEGWTGGTSADGYVGALLANIQRVNEKDGVNGIAMFNDVLRDAIKGSVFDIKDTGFANGGNPAVTDSVIFGLNGGVYDSALGTANKNNWWAYNPTNVINYCSAHDNNTLWDRICSVYGTDAQTLENRLAMNRLAGAMVQVSLGVPFMLAGEEMLRAKINDDGSYNGNSYNSSDKVNNIRWDDLKADSSEYRTMTYYKGLIEFRKAHPALRQTVSKTDSDVALTLVEKSGAYIAYTVKDLVGGEEILIVLNGMSGKANCTLPEGSWDLFIDGTRAGCTPLSENLTGEYEVNGVSCCVFVKK